MSGNPQSRASPDVEKGFRDALAKFKVRLTPTEREKFKFTTLEELRCEIKDIQTRQAAKGENMNMTRIQGFLEGFKQLGEVVEVFLNSSDFVAFVWGPMKFLLNIASNFAERFEILLRAYEQIGECLPLVAQHRELFTGHTYMDELLGLLYRDILDFHRQALRIFQLPTWRQVFSSVWKRFETQFDNLLQGLRRHKELIENQATVQHFRNYQADHKVLLQKLDALEADICNRQYHAVLQWLSPTDTGSDHRSIARVRTDSSGSGAWLLRHVNYRAWRTDDVPRFPVLWLRGIPGAGKSVLASRVIDDCTGNRKARTAFFYCKHGDDRRTSTVAILRSLLGQLVDSHHILLPWLFDQHLSSGQPTLTSGPMAAELLETVATTGDRTFLIIDGLDECPLEQRKVFMSYLNAITSMCERQNPGQVRLILLSQDEPDIRRSLTNFAEIALSALDNEEDIHLFVERRCGDIRKRFQDIDNHLIEHIIKSTCDKAEGMFLFAELVMLNLLNQRCLADLEFQVVDQFPLDLGQAYARILDRIGNNSNTGDVDIARQVLAWMTCAKRPLKWSEIQGAISIDVQAEVVDFRGRSSPMHIREICGSLITLIDEDRIELVHTTAKQYLASSEFVDPVISHARLASLCLDYLSFPDFNPNVSQLDCESLVKSGYFAFMDYAAAHWSDHLVIAVQKMPLESSNSESGAKFELETAISSFVAHYELQTGPSDQDETQKASRVNEISCQGFQNSECLVDLLSVFRYMSAQKSRGIDALDDIGPSPLNVIVSIVRTALEDLSVDDRISEEESKKLKACYGPNWFKCPKSTCYYFHEGFQKLRSRKTHIDRHERPYRCTHPDCTDGFKLGFTKKTDLEKHIRNSHPEEGPVAVTFARIRKAKEKARPSSDSKTTKHPAKHFCGACDRSFTRASILRTHMFTHDNIKPYACVVCPHRVARSNDLRRHMTQVHKDKASFTCQGKLKRGVPGLAWGYWGCGAVFGTVDEYLNHVRTDAGKKCIQPLLENEAEERRLKEQIEQRKAQGLQLPDPRRSQREASSDGEGSSDASFPATSKAGAWKPFGEDHVSPLPGTTGNGPLEHDDLMPSQRTESGLPGDTFVTTTSDNSVIDVEGGSEHVPAIA